MRRLSTRSIIALSCLGLVAACYQPRTDDDVLGDGLARPSDLFEPDASTIPVCPNPDPSPLSALRIHVRTSSFGGRFAPRNVGAIWIEDRDGDFVKTVKRWGQTRAKWLTRFVAASDENLVDAITGATLPVHQTHDATWNLMDLAHCEIGAGEYRVVFEMTERSGTGELVAVPFVKDQTPSTTSPGDTPYFHDLQFVLE